MLSLAPLEGRPGIRNQWFSRCVRRTPVARRSDFPSAPLPIACLPSDPLPSDVPSGAPLPLRPARALIPDPWPRASRSLLAVPLTQVDQRVQHLVLRLDGLRIGLVHALGR